MVAIHHFCEWSLTLSRNCRHFLRFAFKVVLASTAVYWTNQWEVWSHLDENKKRTYEQLLDCSKAIIRQNTPDALKFQVILHGAAREFVLSAFAVHQTHTPPTNPMSAQRLFPLILCVDPLQIPTFVNKDLCALTTHYYNQGVLNTFDFLVNIPTKACSLYDTVADQLNAPPQKAAAASKWTE